MLSLTVRRILAALLVLVVFGSAIAWFARRPLADAAIRRAIDARGVQASYTVKSIGLRWERIENLRIGNPQSPDLTADWADIRVSAGFGGVSLRAVRAGGVRVRGRIVDGQLRFGQIDKLLGARDVKTSFALPDLDVDVADMRVRIDSPWGQIGGRIDGKGNLANGFAGMLAAVMPTMRVPNCTGQHVTAYLDVVVRNRAPTLTGPVRALSVACTGVTAAKPVARVDVALNAGLDRWRGSAALETPGVSTAEAVVSTVRGQVSFEGTSADTSGSADFSAAAARIGVTRAANLGLKGQFSTKTALRGHGRVSVGRLLPDARLAGRLKSISGSAADTPVGPLLVKLTNAVRGASTGLAVVADAEFSDGDVVITRLEAKSPGGALLETKGDGGIRFGAAGFSANTQVHLSGGGFPTLESTLQRRADGMTFGIIRIAPFKAGGARIAVDRVRFAANASGAVRLETATELDGPLFGGQIRGLRLPVNVTISANGRATFNNGCTPIAFGMVQISGLALDPAKFSICPVVGGALIRSGTGQISGGGAVDAPRLTGRLGGTPIKLAARNARLILGTNGFSAANVSALLGGGDDLSRLEIGSLRGRLVRSTVQGSFDNATGKIGKVPLVMDRAVGNWTFGKGALVIRGQLGLSNAGVPGRFNPLVSDDAVLRLVDGQIAATATLRTPDRRAVVTAVTLAHDLGAGTGTATLVVDTLRFGKALQPEALTRLTLGVVANVEGAVSGRGDIRWSPKGLSSTGRFGTAGLDFAAAFGPVAGLKGDIVFDDLLALATPPGQRVTIASVNPGTLVTNGVIVYQLLPDQRIAVESGAWPFAGGDLLLDPTTLDMGQESERKLTFRVVGLDAAKFIQQLEFENLAATGIFDGIMPMYFDADGGRIEMGRLVVRLGGGTLAYVGEISNTAMNVYAKLAFDALKSIRYKNLTIGLNGPLDGEIVSQINFNGVNEAPLSPPKSFIARQFIGLPFVFNIKVTAPFRSLLNTARTFQDPSALLQRTVPELRKPPVQTPESETTP